MEKLKKVFSPGHHKDEEVLYNDSKTSGQGSHTSTTAPTTTTGHSATTSQLGSEQSTSSVGKDADLRRHVLHSEANAPSRPTPSTQLSSASGVADDASVASIRSGVVGAGQSSPLDPDTISRPTGATDYATGTTGTLPDRTATGNASGAYPMSSGNTTTNFISTPRPGNQRIPTMDPESGHQHEGRGHKFGGDPCPPGQEPEVPGYIHHFKGPHGTDIANRLDPHVHIPGEFPTDEGLDPHNNAASSRDMSLGSGAGTAALEGDRLQNQRSVPQESQRDHHYGRDAALAGGAGAAGLGAYEARKHHDERPSETTTAPREGHHLGRDAALASGAGAAGVGAYETHKHHEDRSASNTLGSTGTSNTAVPSPTAASSSTAAPSSTDRSFPLSGSSQPASDRLTSETPREHHLGRDAALAGGAGAAGLAAHEAGTHSHSHSHDAPFHGAGRFDDQRFDPSAAHPDRPTHIPNLMYGSSTTHSAQSPDSQHHYGSDAAVAGGVGAAGVGAYETSKRAGPTDTDPASKTVGPHKSNLANIVDPRVLPQPEKQKDHVTSGPHQSDTMNTMDPRVDSNKTQDPQHHYGRDAAIAGGAGAAGVGAYEYGKHRGGSTDTDPASRTTGPHQSNVANVVDPRVQPQPEKMKDRTTAGPYQSDTMNRADPRVDSDLSRQKENHYGRDAALVGGAGAAGVGAYEYGKHREAYPTRHTTGTQQTNVGNIANPQVQSQSGLNDRTTAGPHQSNTMNRADPRVDSDLSQQQKSHHYGRDAAVAGGVGAAGVGAYEYANHRAGPTEQDPASYTTGPHKSNVANVVDPRVQPEPEKMKDRTTAGPHQSDTLNRADPRVDSDLSKQNKDHHYGRDAAIAGGAGAAGYGAYEALDSKEQEKLAKQQAKEAEKAQKAQQKEMDKELKHQEKERQHEIAKQEKAAQKERDHEQKAAAAAAAAEEKKAEKQHEHDLKKAEKQREHDEKKAEKQHEHDEKKAAKKHEHEQKLIDEERERKEKEAAALAATSREHAEHKHDNDPEEKEEKAEKKHHLFGFLHRDKPKEPEEEKELKQAGNFQEADRLAHERHQRELETGAAAGTVSAAGAKFEPPLEEQQQRPLESAPQYVSIDDNGHQHVSTGKDGRHRLHKDPPASVLKERGIDPSDSSYTNRTSTSSRYS